MTAKRIAVALTMIAVAATLAGCPAGSDDKVTPTPTVKPVPADDSHQPPPLGSS
ncbi:hypothetical protein BJ973_004870 [Actinoplanes tereljensis]|uniref:Uncharacterized protein n=1 Tax=Paractinoplanes tereljensis TaxID=571912 RepID=A0A919NMU1_9ACTN|nr:hypothetical protein [Actinoplanes tereljensis]GIF21685.1 hypothetical protein Ate02nite_44150 [Actinoplanes tereljensis]